MDASFHIYCFWLIYFRSSPPLITSLTTVFQEHLYETTKKKEKKKRVNFKMSMWEMFKFWLIIKVKEMWWTWPSITICGFLNLPGLRRGIIDWNVEKSEREEKWRMFDKNWNIKNGRELEGLTRERRKFLRKRKQKKKSESFSFIRMNLSSDFLLSCQRRQSLSVVFLKTTLVMLFLRKYVFSVCFTPSRSLAS